MPNFYRASGSLLWRMLADPSEYSNIPHLLQTRSAGIKKPTDPSSQSRQRIQAKEEGARWEPDKNVVEQQ